MYYISFLLEKLLISFRGNFNIVIYVPSQVLFIILHHLCNKQKKSMVFYCLILNRTHVLDKYVVCEMYETNYTFANLVLCNTV